MLPLTYGVDILHGAIGGQNMMPIDVDFLLLGTSCLGLLVLSRRNIHGKWLL